MRRLPISLLLCLLLVATGLALVGVGTTLSLPDVAGPAPNAEADITLVRAFYAAVDAVLTTGESDRLDDLVAPDLIEHPAPPLDTAGRAGLLRSLLAHRAAFPELRLVVDDVQASSNHLVTARIHATGTTAGTFLGLRLPEGLASWGPIDVLRVVDGRIAERWTGNEAALFEPLGRATVVGSGTAPWSRPVALTRLTAPPHARVTIRNGPASRVVLLESGAVTAEATNRPSGTVVVSGDGDRSTILVPGRSRRVAPGDLLVTAPGAAFALANDDSAPAVVLVATVFGPGEALFRDNVLARAAATAVGVTSSTGVSTEVLAIEPGMPVPPGSILGIGRVSLAAGTSLALPAAPGTALVAVETGHVELATIGGDAQGSLADDQPWAGHTAALESGAGVSFGAGIGGLWRAGDDDPATLLVLIVTPPPPDSPWAEELIVASPTAPIRFCRDCP